MMSVISGHVIERQQVICLILIKSSSSIYLKRKVLLKECLDQFYFHCGPDKVAFFAICMHINCLKCAISHSDCEIIAI